MLGFSYKALIFKLLISIINYIGINLSNLSNQILKILSILSIKWNILDFE